MKNRTKGIVALLLTFSAGCVDIIGFLSLYHTFTAHMTGVTVHLGQNLAQSSFYDCAVLAATVGIFMFGSVLGRTLVEASFRHGWRSVATAPLVLEFALLCTVASMGSPERRVSMVLLLATAMGVQTAILTRVGSLTIHTTFVTGMLNKLAQLLSHTLFLEFDHLLGRRGRSHLRPVVHRQALFIFTIWSFYLVGAVAGTTAETHWKTRALFLPAAIVLGVTVVDQFRPLPLQEERDKSER